MLSCTQSVSRSSAVKEGFLNERHIGGVLSVYAFEEGIGAFLEVIWALMLRKFITLIMFKFSRK